MGNCAQATKKANIIEPTDTVDRFDPLSERWVKSEDAWNLSPYVEKSHFKLTQVIGIGSHGVVWLVERRKGKQIGLKEKAITAEDQHAAKEAAKVGPKPSEGEEDKQQAEQGDKQDADGNTIVDAFAMKVMDKGVLYKLRSIESVHSELNILSLMMHPLVLNLNYAFHD